jgi:hypothetical protein
LSSAFTSLVAWPSIVFCISVSVFFLRLSITWVTSFLILSILSLIYLSLFTVFSVSLWYLFRAPMCSLICFCVFSYSLFLLSCNFLSASCTCWLTLSYNSSMKLSVISSFRVFLWASLCSLG